MPASVEGKANLILKLVLDGKIPSDQARDILAAAESAMGIRDGERIRLVTEDQKKLLDKLEAEGKK